MKEVKLLVESEKSRATLSAALAECGCPVWVTKDAPKGEFFVNNYYVNFLVSDANISSEKRNGKQ